MCFHRCAQGLQAFSVCRLVSFSPGKFSWDDFVRDFFPPSVFSSLSFSKACHLMFNFSSDFLFFFSGIQFFLFLFSFSPHFPLLSKTFLQLYFFFYWVFLFLLSYFNFISLGLYLMNIYIYILKSSFCIVWNVSYKLLPPSLLPPHLQHVEVPGLGVESELQPSVYTSVTGKPDPSHICDLHRCSGQHQIL